MIPRHCAKSAIFSTFPIGKSATLNTILLRKLFSQDTANPCMMRHWTLLKNWFDKFGVCGVQRLGMLFAYFHKSLPPPVRLEKRYVFLYVQYLRLKATAYLEKKQYKVV